MSSIELTTVKKKRSNLLLFNPLLKTTKKVLNGKKEGDGVSKKERKSLN